MAKQIGQPKPIMVILRAYGEEHICSYLPTGWRDQSASWIFQYKTFGFDRKYSAEKLRFILEDADFLRKLIDEYGISAEIDFIVQHRQNNWTYADSFTGQVDLAAGYINDRDFVEVGVVEGGLKRAYAKNQKTNYELPLNDPDAVDIEVPEGMRLYEDIDFLTEGRDSGNPYYWENYNSDLAIFYRDIGINKDNVKSSQLIFAKQMVVKNTDGTISSSPFLKAIRDSRYMNDLSLDFNATLSQSSNSLLLGNFYFGVKRGTSFSNAVKIAEYEVPAVDTANNKPVSFTLSFPVRIGSMSSSSEEYYFYYIVGKSEHRNFVGEINISYFGVENTGKFSFKAFRAETLANRLVKKIHAPAACQIPFLSAMEQQGMQLFLTSGDGIRGISEAQIKTNFQEFQNNLSCLFDIGAQVSNEENAYKIVEKPVIFNRDQPLLNPDKSPLDLGKVKEMQIKPISDEWMASNINVGYEKQKYDYPLGRQDFACTMEYINALKMPNKKMDLVSKYRADYTGVHLLHYDYVNSDKKDSKSDNDIFWILAFQKDGKWQAIKGDAVIIVDGLEGGGYFNILLSPHWNLRRHKNYLKSILDRHSKELTYTSSTETQTDIRSTYNGRTITEKTGENVSSGTVLFKPIVFEFDALIRKNLAEVMGETPAGYVTFNFNGVTCKGFPIEITGSITDSSQKVTCVAHPDTPSNIQQLMFSKGGKRPAENENIINIVVTGDMEDTLYTVKASKPTESELIVTVRIEGSYDNGQTWEIDIMGEETVFLIPQGGKNATLTEGHPNPTEYTNRRFTILNIVPNEDSEFKYVKGGQVVL